MIYFITTKILNRRQVCWAELLILYNFQIYYQKGLENEKTDALNRRADYREGIKPEPYSILRINQNSTIEYNYRMQVNSLIIKKDL